MRKYREELDRRERLRQLRWKIGFAIGIAILLAGFYGALVLLAGME